MSMISVQIDELRKLADDIESRYGYPTAVKALRYAADTICQLRDDLQRTNAEYAKLREQMERLVTLLRVDCDIDASWDGLRRFWSIGLTENGCLMRDRACKAEVENAKLREELANAPKCETCEAMLDCDECLRADGSHKERRRLSVENAKLREQAARAWRLFTENGAVHPSDLSEVDAVRDGLRELGVEVSDA